jgi:hypothetical protein
MLFAWGVHDLDAFGAAADERGYSWANPRHGRFIELRRRLDGTFGKRYEPVQGEPNATYACP